MAQHPTLWGGRPRERVAGTQSCGLPRCVEDHTANARHPHPTHRPDEDDHHPMMAPRPRQTTATTRPAPLQPGRRGRCHARQRRRPPPSEVAAHTQFPRTSCQCSHAKKTSPSAQTRRVKRHQWPHPGRSGGVRNDSGRGGPKGGAGNSGGGARLLGTLSGRSIRPWWQTRRGLHRGQPLQTGPSSNAGTRHKRAERERQPLLR